MDIRNLRHIAISTPPYKIVLIIAVFLLLSIAGINYLQIKNLQTSAEWVSRSVTVDKEINNLFSQYNLMESAEFRAVILGDSTFAESYIDHKLQSDKTLIRLYELTKEISDHEASLDSVTILKDSLHATLTALHGKVRPVDSDSIVFVYVQRAAAILKSLRGIRTHMLLTKEANLQERLATYNKQAVLTPITSLMLTLFSLGIFVVAFLKIRSDKNQIQASEALLQNIVQTTDNIMNYYEPVYNADNEVIDFKIIFANECNFDYLGLDPDKIIGKPISKIFSFLLVNGELEEMIEGFKNGETLNLERQVTVKGETLWLHSIIKPMDNGILAVIRNKSGEKEAEENLRLVNEQLEIQNSIMSESKRLAKIGSYVWHLESDTAEFSENLYRILAFSAGDFLSSFENYHKLIHPEDLSEYEETMRAAKETHVPPDHTYKAISKNGSIIYLREKGKFVKKNGEDVLIGVVQDVTDHIKAENNLRARNEALNRSNAELDAFNRVVSHDLQEPLRKIQMFISRLDASEKSKLSQKGRENFEKVNKAASRMQSLIVNLLTYSRIGSSSEDFEEVDLNLILEKVREDMAEAISGEQAKIEHEVLPAVAGISFQMEQLFGNLISNAIKYSDPETSTRILIKSEKVNKDQIPEDFVKSSKNYHKITFVDNGIGFANENSKKIFEVFQRLHQKNEYSGTGIGLAICKKIVENHHGFIHAMSELGKGSAFIIYLPA